MVALATMTPLATVPRLWPGRTIVCLAPGPSLTADDCAYVHGKAPTIAISDAYRLAPWADVLYSSDQYWWPAHDGVPSFGGLKYALTPRQTSWHGFSRWPEIQVLANTGADGLEPSPHGLRNGRNSGYAAINLAVHLGASTVVLVGYDMGVGPRGEAHFDGVVKSAPQYHAFVSRFDALRAPLAAAGVRVVNCSRRTALKTFPRQALAEVLS